MTAPQWPGTPAEWDAERDRRKEALHDANGRLGAVSYKDLATATMPPRPVEPPSVVTASGWRVRYVSDTREFYAEKGERLSSMRSKAHSIAFDTGATEAEHDAIRALRDGPTARYEPDAGMWRVRFKDGTHAFTADDQLQAEEHARRLGGTAHAIYKRVGGEG